MCHCCIAQNNSIARAEKISKCVKDLLEGEKYDIWAAGAVIGETLNTLVKKVNSEDGYIDDINAMPYYKIRGRNQEIIYRTISHLTWAIIKNRHDDQSPYDVIKEIKEVFTRCIDNTLETLERVERRQQQDKLTSQPQDS
jgi:hypothetical protein